MKVLTRTIKNAFIIITLGLSSLSYAAPVTFNFDDLDEPNVLTGPGFVHDRIKEYGGLKFAPYTYVGSAIITTGYAKASSGTNYAHFLKSVSSYGANHANAILMSSSRPFDFKEAHIARQFGLSDKLNFRTMKLIGYDANNKQIATKTINLSNSMKKVTFNWKNISHIYAKGIATHPTQYQSTINLYMDDIVVDFGESAEVPIPAAAFLFAPALLGFMGIRRKAKANALD